MPAASARSVRTARFKLMHSRLPKPVQRIADRLFEVFEKNPEDPRLQTENLHDNSKGSHRDGSKSIRLTQQYRSIYVVDNGKDGDGPTQYCWYWTGSHADYDRFTGA